MPVVWYVRHGDLAAGFPAARLGLLSVVDLRDMLAGDLAYDPLDVLLWWNYALVSGQLGDAYKAQVALARAHALAPPNKTILTLFLQIP